MLCLRYMPYALLMPAIIDADIERLFAAAYARDTYADTLAFADSRYVAATRLLRRFSPLRFFARLLMPLFSMSLLRRCRLSSRHYAAYFRYATRWRQLCLRCRHATPCCCLAIAADDYRCRFDFSSCHAIFSPLSLRYSTQPPCCHAIAAAALICR